MYSRRTYDKNAGLLLPAAFALAIRCPRTPLRMGTTVATSQGKASVNVTLYVQRGSLPRYV